MYKVRKFFPLANTGWYAIVFILPLMRTSPEPVYPCNELFIRSFKKFFDSGECNEVESTD
jgi:hypothetical protein